MKICVCLCHRCQMHFWPFLITFNLASRWMKQESPPVDAQICFVQFKTINSWIFWISLQYRKATFTLYHIQAYHWKQSQNPSKTSYSVHFCGVKWKGTLMQMDITKRERRLILTTVTTLTWHSAVCNSVGSQRLKMLPSLARQRLLPMTAEHKPFWVHPMVFLQTIMPGPKHHLQIPFDFSVIGPGRTGFINSCTPGRREERQQNKANNIPRPPFLASSHETNATRRAGLIPWDYVVQLPVWMPTYRPSLYHICTDQGPTE